MESVNWRNRDSRSVRPISSVVFASALANASEFLSTQHDHSNDLSRLTSQPPTAEVQGKNQDSVPGKHIKQL